MLEDKTRYGGYDGQGRGMPQWEIRHFPRRRLLSKGLKMRTQTAGEVGTEAGEDGAQLESSGISEEANGWSRQSTGERGRTEEAGGRPGGHRSPLQAHRPLLWARWEPPRGWKQRSAMTLLAKGRADCRSRIGYRRREGQRIQGLARQAPEGQPSLTTALDAIEWCNFRLFAFNLNF